METISPGLTVSWLMTPSMGERSVVCESLYRVCSKRTCARFSTVTACSYWCSHFFFCSSADTRSIRACSCSRCFALASSLEIPDWGEQAPELRETRELIDDVDRQLVRLLGQRMQISRRVGKIKAEHGKLVRDVEREQALLAKRKEWACEYGLDPEAVSGLYDAILQSSRTLQEE